MATSGALTFTRWWEHESEMILFDPNPDDFSAGNGRQTVFLESLID